MFPLTKTIQGRDPSMERRMQAAGSSLTNFPMNTIITRRAKSIILTPLIIHRITTNLKIRRRERFHSQRSHLKMTRSLVRIILRTWAVILITKALSCKTHSNIKLHKTIRTLILWQLVKTLHMLNLLMKLRLRTRKGKDLERIWSRVKTITMTIWTGNLLSHQRIPKVNHSLTPKIIMKTRQPGPREQPNSLRLLKNKTKRREATITISNSKEAIMLTPRTTWSLLVTILLMMG